ncbi:MAG: alkaline phosphatase D family protein [Myxococcota bacterium]
MARQTRRQFLRVTAVGGAGLVLGCGRSPAVGGDGEDGGLPADELDAGTTLPTDAGVDAGVDAGQSLTPDEPELLTEGFNFPLGLASGDVEPTRAMLWTKYAGSSALRLRVWRMNGAVYAERVADTLVMPGDGGFVHLDVEGLEPGARYRYAFFEESAQGELQARSAIGKFRAALATGQREVLTFGACSCTQQGHTPTPLSRASELGLDAFLLLGDTSYNDGADTLAEYRTKWAANLGSPEYRRLRASTSVVAAWDDHEVENNFNPETIDPAKLATAKRTFFEALPLRRHATEPDRLWKSLRWGDTVELFVLDARGERKPSTRLRSEQVYLSRAQLDWLKAGLAASTAVFKLVLNSVPITDFGFSAFTGDGWLSYPQQRTELLGWVEDQGIEGVLWVSGDHHFASVGKVSLLGRGREALEVLAGPGAQDANPVWPLLRPPRWDFASGTNNFVTLRLDPMTRTVRLAFVDGDGHELFAKDYVL